jgi:hypothetical protein
MNNNYCAECGNWNSRIVLMRSGTALVVGYSCCPEHAAMSCARMERYGEDTRAIVAWANGRLVADAEGVADGDHDGPGESYTRNAGTCVGGDGE